VLTRLGFVGAGYAQLRPALWAQLDRLSALPLVLTSFYDLRNADDLALRQAAATVRSR
jgi:U3 small nucleolar RNA-associated protein 20